MQMGTTMVLDSNMGFQYSVPGSMTPPEHGPTEIMVQHNSMQPAALPVNVNGAHGFAYHAPEISQYGQNSGPYQAPHTMYSLEEVSSMYSGQQVPVPNHAVHGQGQPHSMGNINPIYEESEDLRQRRLAFQYHQAWNDSVPGNSYHQ